MYSNNNSYHNYKMHPQQTSLNYLQQPLQVQLNKQTHMNHVMSQQYQQKMGTQSQIYRTSQPYMNVNMHRPQELMIQNYNIAPRQYQKSQHNIPLMQQGGISQTYETYRIPSIQQNDQGPDYSQTNNSLNNSKGGISPQKSPEFSQSQSQSLRWFNKSNQHTNSTKILHDNTYQQPPAPIPVNLISKSVRTSDYKKRQMPLKTVNESFTVQQKIPFTFSGYQTQEFRKKQNKQAQRDSSTQKQCIGSSKQILKTSINKQSSRELDVKQVLGVGKQQNQFDVHRRNSITLFEMNFDMNENQMLQQLNMSTMDNDIEEVDEEKLISMKNILQRLNEQSSETLAKAKLLKVLVNGLLYEREFHIDIGQIPQEWKLKQLASILNKMYSEQMGGEEFSNNKFLKSIELKQPTISILADQQMKIFQLIDLAVSGQMGPDNLIILEESTI